MTKAKTGNREPDGRPVPPLAGEIVEEAMSTALTNVSPRDAIPMDDSLAVSLTRAEIDQQVATAHAYPRSVDVALKAITSLATFDTQTAMECVYALPAPKDRDGQSKGEAIEGPSIRLAELIAQQWGNNRADAGVTAIDTKEGFVIAEGTYHDLETNTAVRTRVRRSIKGKYGLFPAHMIDKTANAATSIALRNAILRGVPKPIWRAAYEKCRAVIRGDEKTLHQRKLDLVAKFGEIGVKPSDVLKLAGVQGEKDIGLDEIVNLAGIYTALRNNEATAEDFLAPVDRAQAKALNAAPRGSANRAAPPPPAKSPQDAPETASEGSGAPDTEKTAEASPAPAVAAGDTDPAPADPATPAGPDKAEPRKPSAAEAALAEEDEDEQADDQAGTLADDEDALADQADDEDGDEDPVAASAEDFSWDAAPQAFHDFIAAAQGTDSWLTIKAAFQRLMKSEDWAAVSELAHEAAKAACYSEARRVQDSHRDPVTVEAEPLLFHVWLATYPPKEAVQEAWRKLARSPAYQKLAPAGKDAMATAVSDYLEAPDAA